VRELGRRKRFVASVTAVAMVAGVKVVVFRLAKLDRGLWRYISAIDLVRLAFANLAASAAACALILGFGREGFPRSIYLLDLMICFLLTSGLRLAVRIGLEATSDRWRSRETEKRTLIYGAGGAGTALLREIRSNAKLAYRVIGFVDDLAERKGMRVTLYTDSEAHDSVSPVSNLPYACYRPGVYLAHVPGIPKLDVRVEAVSTDPSTSKSQGGHYEYYEELQVQGYTNKGALFGDWIGREDKGGQGWIAYHLSANEWIEAGMRNQKAAKDFIPGGTTLNDLSIRVVKRMRKDIEIDGSFTWERWKAPVYLPGLQNVTTTSVRVTWFPGAKQGK